MVIALGARVSEDCEGRGWPPMIDRRALLAYGALLPLAGHTLLTVESWAPVSTEKGGRPPFSYDHRDRRTASVTARMMPLVLGMCVLSHLTLENFITTGPA